ncbi:uro-adherence factor A-like isoform X1 [Palaemon carinicauda]|uniref:uro-adherence factor A-like isoform X1 n=1 Tax=Palaemon carinicauda TaxID=392227 RepID=UPI0035B68C01
MANKSRKRTSYQDRNDGDVVVIESSEEDEESLHTIENQDNNIEEDEEFTMSGRRRLPSCSNYQPLVIKKLRCKVKSVNQERTVNIDRKTVLYGQTPKAVRLKQLQEMAELNGMSLVEFSQHVVDGSTFDNLMILQNFHTKSQPQLLPLFESLQHSIQGDEKSLETGRYSLKVSQPVLSNSSESQKNGANLNELKNVGAFESIVDMQRSRNGDNLSEMCNINESESFSYLGTGYSENSTVPICDSLPHRTVISETESDSDSNGDINFPCSSEHKFIDSLSIDPSPSGELSVESTAQSSLASNVLDVTDCSETSGDHAKTHEKDNCSIEGSVTCFVKKSFDSVKGGRKSDSFEHSNSRLHVDIENSSKSKDYNHFLDDLLFNNAPKKTVEKASQNSDERIEKRKGLSQKQVFNNSGVASCSKYHEKIKKNSQLLNSRERHHTSIHDNDSHNTILDQLLSDHTIGSSESDSDQSSDVLENVDCVLPSTSSQHKKLATISSDSVMRGNCKAACKSGRTTEIITYKADISSKDKDECLVDSNDEIQVLPTSLELQHSLWNGLDKSLDY